MCERKTITVDPETWQKYCHLKSLYLRDLGRPELNFTEFVNACVRYSDMTVKQILDLRKERRK